MGIEAMKERIDELMEARQKLWIAACEADGIDPAASFKALKEARARRLRRAAAESLGLRAVRGAVTGATYYE